MKLRRVSVRHLPGIPQPFTLEPLADGLTVIHGPNGIGKSSLARAIGELFWGEASPGSGISVEARLALSGRQWQIECDGALHRWQCEGVESPPPPLPPKHLQGCFFLTLRDLLDASDTAGRDLASEIRRQMAGGYDLEGLSAELGRATRAPTGKKERDALNATDQKIRLSMAQQRRLAARQDEIPDLEAQADRAREASLRLPHLSDALELLERREALAQIEARLQSLPPALERVTGAEIAHAEEIEAERAKKAQAIRDEQRKLASARAAAANTGLAAPVDPAILGACQLQTRQLLELDRLRAAARTSLAEADQQLAAASRQVGGHAAPPADLDVDQASTLFDFLRKAEQARTEQDALEERIALLARQAGDPDRHARIDRLRNATRSLSDWLRAPDPDAPPAQAVLWPERRWLAWIAGALAVLGGGLGGWLDGRFYALISVGAGLALAAALTRIRRTEASDEARSLAQRDFPNGVGAPTAWSVRPVRERLSQLQDELAREEAAEQRSHYQEADRAELEVKLESARSRVPELEAARTRIAGQLGLETLPATLDLVDLARALDALRSAVRKKEGAAARLSELDQQVAEGMAKLAPELSAAAAHPPCNATEARAAAESLEHRDQDLRHANGLISEHGKRISELEDESGRLEERGTQLYASLDLAPGDRGALEALVAGREGYQQLRARRNELVTQISVLDGKLEHAGERQLANVSRPVLEQQHDDLEQRANTLESIRQKLANIRAEIRSAEGTHTLEVALSARHEALLELAERREEALQAEASALLLEAVITEHESAQAPRVLERARSHFRTFTHSSYELRVPSDGDSAFVAVESESGRGLKLAELSDGTRAQLILAARLAFAEESEVGERMPLVLDEVLDHADPLRFDAIARSLARMTADGDRQILYLTHDPSELLRMRSAFEAEGCTRLREIDLAAARARTAAVQTPAEVDVPPLPPVPSPEGRTPEEYAPLIRATRFDPQRDAKGQDLFYLLGDDLPLLAFLREQRITSVGQWLTLARSNARVAAEVQRGSPAGRELGERARLLASFLAVRQEGRGKPVDRGFIEGAASVSAHYREALVTICKEVGGNADELERILQERTDARLKGFRRSKAEELLSALREGGYLDPRPVLEEAELVTRLHASPAARVLSGSTLGALAHQWWILSERAIHAAA